MSLADFMATCTSITGTGIPDGAGEDSISALPLFMGSEEPIREDAVFHSGKGYFSILKENWKLSLCSDSGGHWNPENLPDDLPPVQLHDLSKDIGERTNLHAEYPEMVSELTERIEQIVAHGRSTPGPRKGNDVPVDIWKLETRTGGTHPIGSP
jgi:arylsulfatase A